MKVSPNRVERIYGLYFCFDLIPIFIYPKHYLRPSSNRSLLLQLFLPTSTSGYPSNSTFPETDTQTGYRKNFYSIVIRIEAKYLRLGLRLSTLSSGFQCVDHSLS